MINKLKFILGATLITSLTSCFWKAGGNYTGIEYAPDMYYSKGYEPMSQFTDSSKYRYNPYFMTMREPVKGTIAQGQLDYQYMLDNSADGYAASATIEMPTNLTEKEQINGERLFNTYCSVCHGKNGGNDGAVATKQAVLKPAWANMQTDEFKAKTPGTIYHVFTYGKNNMGSYAYALSPKDRWSVISYVERLKQLDSLGNIPGIKANAAVVGSSIDDAKADNSNDAGKQTNRRVEIGFKNK